FRRRRSCRLRISNVLGGSSRQYRRERWCSDYGGCICMSDTTVASTVTVTIDGHQVTVPPGTTLYDAALSAGIRIPVLCHSPKLQPVAACRMCVVEVQGARVLPPACFG